MIADKMQVLVEKSSLIRAMFEEGKRLANIHGAENVYDFSLGNPNVAPPKEVEEAIKDIVANEHPNKVHGYMNNSGYEDVREEIAIYTNAQYGTKVKKDHIVMTCGAAGGLNIIFKTLLNPNDEVVVFAPFFGEYQNYCDNYDAMLKVIPANTKTFMPNLEILEEEISEKTKIVIVNSPNNPSGVVYDEKTITSLADMLGKKEEEYGTKIYIVSDEPYREIVYDEIKVPYLLNYYKNCIVGYSYSKSLSLPGERIGYLVVHPEIEDVENIMVSLNVANRILGFVNAPSLFQRVIGRTLGVGVDVSIYKKNRDLLYEHLQKVGYEVVKPDGAFYMFVKSPIEDDVKFCTMAKQHKLLVVPGSAFGCNGYFRIAYCVGYEIIENSLSAFQKVMDDVKIMEEV